MPDQEKRTSLVLPSHLHERLKAISKRESITFNQAATQAIELWTATEATIQEASASPALDLQQLAKTLGTFSNPYEKIVASWRIQRLMSQIVGIASEKFALEARSAEQYAMTIVAALTRRLQRGDHYFAVTNTRYWQEVKAQNAVYRTVQEEAVRRGMVFHRIFLIVQDDSDDVDGLKEEVRRQLAMQERFDTDFKGQTSTQYVDLRQREGGEKGMSRSDAIQKFGHFAIVRRMNADSENDQGCVVVTTSEDVAGVRRFEFLFSRGSGIGDERTNAYIDKFKQIQEMAEPLESLADDLGCA